MADTRGSTSGQPIPKLTEDEQDRFWDKVLFDVDCWWWTGTKVGKGYGGFSHGPRDDNRCLLAHRVAYRLTHGPISPGMTVSHLCHNRRCVRPAHLTVESIQANLGRSISGEKHRDAKLTADQVREIRRLRHATTLKVLAERYGVHPSTISHIVTGRTWKHVDREAPIG